MKAIAHAERLHLAQDIPKLGQAAVMARIPQFDKELEVHNLRPAPRDHGMPLKAVVLNVERGVHVQETADFLRDAPALADADLILANELDDGVCRSGCRDTTREIADALHLNYAFGLEFIELTNPDDPKGYHGNAIFSRWPIRWAKSLHLPIAYEWYEDKQQRIGTRAALFALLEVGDRTVGAVCVHLENRTDGAGRARQMQAVLEEADRLFGQEIPVIMGGDFNTNTFDGAKTPQIMAMLEEQQRGAPARDVPAMEPLLPMAEAFGYDFRSFSDNAMTRRKPMPGGVLALRLDWIFARGMASAGHGTVSTRTNDCDFARPGTALAAFSEDELSDHDAVWAVCRRKTRATTVLFDMGGTLEDVRADADSIPRITSLLMGQLDALGQKTDLSPAAFGRVLQAGVRRYKAWSQEHERELPTAEIWTDYYLHDFGFDRAVISAYAEQFAGQWEVTYYTRSLRPGAKEMLERLRAAGYRLGVVSNNAALYAVFDMLERYGLRHLFEDVTVSSNTGFRKPAPDIFRIAMLRMGVRPEECIYVGDTVSRDIVGPRRAGMACTIHIESELTATSDTILSAPVSGADHEITELMQIADLLID